MNSNKAKGLTFFETVAAIAIVSSVSLFFYTKICKLQEKKDLELSKIKIQNVFHNYTLKSSYLRSYFEINIYLDDKKIEVKDFKKNILEVIHLPKKLLYGIVYKTNNSSVFNVKTTESGNLSKAFTIYICDYKSMAQNRIAFYTFQNEKILKINTYKNLSAGNILYRDLIKYHYSEEGESRKGWIEE